MNTNKDFENELYIADKRPYAVTIWTLIFSALFALCCLFFVSSMLLADTPDTVAPTIMLLFAALTSLVTLFPLNIVSVIREFRRTPSVNTGKIISVLSFILYLTTSGICLFL